MEAPPPYSMEFQKDDPPPYFPKDPEEGNSAETPSRTGPSSTQQKKIPIQFIWTIKISSYLFAFCFITFFMAFVAKKESSSDFLFPCKYGDLRKSTKEVVQVYENLRMQQKKAEAVNTLLTFTLSPKLKTPLQEAKAITDAEVAMLQRNYTTQRSNYRECYDMNIATQIGLVKNLYEGSLVIYGIVCIFLGIMAFFFHLIRQNQCQNEIIKDSWIWKLISMFKLFYGHIVCWIVIIVFRYVDDTKTKFDMLFPF